MNDRERRLWVLNDEGLYLTYKASGRPLKSFLREERAMIDAAIKRVLDPSTRS